MKEHQQAVPEEKAAVKRCLEGSVEAFEPLVIRHAPRIVRLAYHFLGDWDDANDLAQETFARAFRCLDRYDFQHPFATWLSTIAARLATDKLRRRRTRARVDQALKRVPVHHPDPDITLSLKEALAKLTPRQRQSVVLCDLHGFTAPEAAECPGRLTSILWSDDGRPGASGCSCSSQRARSPDTVPCRAADDRIPRQNLVR